MNYYKHYKQFLKVKSRISNSVNQPFGKLVFRELSFGKLTLSCLTSTSFLYRGNQVDQKEYYSYIKYNKNQCVLSRGQTVHLQRRKYIIVCNIHLLRNYAFLIFRVFVFKVLTGEPKYRNSQFSGMILEFWPELNERH